MTDSTDHSHDAADPSESALQISAKERLGLAVIVCVGIGIWLQRIGINDYNDALANEMIFSRNSLATILR
ncbi:MAG: hypothetical protein JRG94_14510 [Deltaproteobacteria bacterium]|nr:hypothetical protein [Deltaproteobacteria bacterium]